MPWFFRVVEQTDGSWACRRGRANIDSHAALPDAVEHLCGVAEDLRPARLFVHHRDGSVEEITAPQDLQISPAERR